MNGAAWLVICVVLAILVPLVSVFAVWNVGNRRRARFVSRARPGAMVLTVQRGRNTARILRLLEPSQGQPRTVANYFCLSVDDEVVVWVGSWRPDQLLRISGESIAFAAAAVDADLLGSYQYPALILGLRRPSGGIVELPLRITRERLMGPYPVKRGELAMIVEEANSRLALI